MEQRKKLNGFADTMIQETRKRQSLLRVLNTANNNDSQQTNELLSMLVLANSESLRSLSQSEYFLRMMFIRDRHAQRMDEISSKFLRKRKGNKQGKQQRKRIDDQQKSEEKKEEEEFEMEKALADKSLMDGLKACNWYEQQARAGIIKYSDGSGILTPIPKEEQKQEEVDENGKEEVQEEGEQSILDILEEQSQEKAGKLKEVAKGFNQLVYGEESNLEELEETEE